MHAPGVSEEMVSRGFFRIWIVWPEHGATSGSTSAPNAILDVLRARSDDSSGSGRACNRGSR